ncbi:MAG: hypothetical protein IT348_06960, partial [Candidatus Eisenbacteria bacterium]|nr:hypothetical protein [Candidatus Eisenbacteria bacterium]
MQSLLALLTCLVPASLHAAPAVVDTTTWVTNGVVRALATVGDVTYLGGSFTSVGVASGNCAVIRTDTGRPISPFPRVEGTVCAALADGAGGWYIGGDFLAVGSVARRHVAHILADGTIGAWAPRVGTNNGGVVYALARVGNSVVIGGTFGSVNDSVRTRIAAVDATTGELLPFSPTLNNEVRALAVSGSTVYVGGVFNANNSTSRPYLAAYELGSNSPLPFAPRAGQVVRALLLHEGTLYAGGDFGVMGDSTRSRVAALDPFTGAVHGWNPNVNGRVSALAATGSNIVIGGTFTQVRGKPRQNIALWDGLADSLSAWNPGANASVTSLDATPSSVRAVGQF